MNCVHKKSIKVKYDTFCYLLKIRSSQFLTILISFEMLTDDPVFIVDNCSSNLGCGVLGPH